MSSKHCILKHLHFPLSGAARTQTNGFYTYYLKGKRESTFKPDSLEYKLEKLFNFIQAVRAKNNKKDDAVTLDRVKANIDSLYDFKDSIVDYLNDYGDDTHTESSKNDDNRTKAVADDDYDEIITKTIKNHDARPKEVILNNVEQINKTLGDNNKIVIEDQIAEETDLYNKAKIYEGNILNNTFDVIIRRKRDTDLSNHKRDDLELTVVSWNLTLNKDDRTNNTGQDLNISKDISEKNCN